MRLDHTSHAEDQTLPISVAAVIAASVLDTPPAIKNSPLERKMKAMRLMAFEMGNPGFSLRRTYGPAAFGVPSFKNRNQRQRRRDHRRIHSHGWKGGRK